MDVQSCAVLESIYYLMYLMRPPGQVYVNRSHCMTKQAANSGQVCLQAYIQCLKIIVRHGNPLSCVEQTIIVLQIDGGRSWGICCFICQQLVYKGLRSQMQLRGYVHGLLVGRAVDLSKQDSGWCMLTELPVDLDSMGHLPSAVAML